MIRSIDDVSVVFVCRNDNQKIVGFIWVSYKNHASGLRFGSISSLYVSYKYRTEGYGRALL